MIKNGTSLADVENNLCFRPEKGLKSLAEKRENSLTGREKVKKDT